MNGLKRYRSVVADSARWDGFAFRPGDIVMSTPPKCGTTWMQTLCAMLVFDAVEFNPPLAEISPWLDMLIADRAEIVDRLGRQQHRRIIKTHTPLDGLPYDPGVTYICVGRDPRDAACSAVHHAANMDVERFMELRAAAAGLEDLAEIARQRPGPAAEGAPTPLHAWLEGDGREVPMSLAYLLGHLGTFWERRRAPQVALFHYSDLLADLPGQMHRLAGVLGVEMAADRLLELAAAGTFATMKSRAQMVAPCSDVGLWRNTGDFFHRGTSGQWREVFTDGDLCRYQDRVAELASAELAAWAHHGWLGAAIAT
jgi:aryl sulfotransferase